MFFSERLECSSFDKLLENFSENSRKKVCSIFGICKNNVFFLEQSSQLSSGQLKRSSDNTVEDCWRKFKNLKRKVRATMEEVFFFQKNFLTIFPRRI